jgi:hypothetical protein
MKLNNKLKKKVLNKLFLRMENKNWTNNKFTNIDSKLHRSYNIVKINSLNIRFVFNSILRTKLENCFTIFVIILRSSIKNYRKLT